MPPYVIILKNDVEKYAFGLLLQFVRVTIYAMGHQQCIPCVLLFTCDIKVLNVAMEKQ